MKKYRSRIMITSISVIHCNVCTLLYISRNISAQLEDNVFVTHTGGVIKTTGEIIDPVIPL